MDGFLLIDVGYFWVELFVLLFEFCWCLLIDFGVFVGGCVSY